VDSKPIGTEQFDNASNNEFLNKLKNSQLELLWNMWSELGISGYGKPSNGIIDPEALLLYSLILGRSDARLYDEIVDWTIRHSELLSIPRIKSLLCIFPAKKQIGALAELLVEKERHSKWKALISLGSNEMSEPLFYMHEGASLPITGEPDPRFLQHGLIRSVWNWRKHSQSFNPNTSGAFILKLRAFMGVTARCEIIASLIEGTEKHPSQIAREIAFASKTTQETLVQMAQSDIISVRPRGREKLYHLNSAFTFSVTNGSNPRFVPWILLFELSLQLITLYEKSSKGNLSELAFLAMFRNTVEPFENRLLDAGVSRELLTDQNFANGADFMIQIYRVLIGQ